MPFRKICKLFETNARCLQISVRQALQHFFRMDLSRILSYSSEFLPQNISSPESSSSYNPKANRTNPAASQVIPQREQPGNRFLRAVLSNIEKTCLQTYFFSTRKSKNSGIDNSPEPPVLFCRTLQKLFNALWRKL